MQAVIVIKHSWCDNSAADNCSVELTAVKEGEDILQKFVEAVYNYAQERMWLAKGLELIDGGYDEDEAFEYCMNVCPHFKVSRIQMLKEEYGKKMYCDYDDGDDYFECFVFTGKEE